MSIPKWSLGLARRALSGWVPGGGHECVLCGYAIWQFMPYRGGRKAVPKLMWALDVVGSDVDRFACPRCGAHDRERHLMMYLRASGLLEYLRGRSMLHFAPERRLPRLIRDVGPSRYVKCDLRPQTPGVEAVDIMDIPFEASAFDMVMANHVLEHVCDDRMAVEEVARVLKPGGYAILQTPYSNKLLTTWEDAGISDRRTRFAAYGHEDHMRLYGRDIFDRFASAGLQSLVRTHDEVLPDVDATKAGVNPAEPFFLFQKPSASSGEN